MTSGASGGRSQATDRARDEWAECRITIGRMDAILADIRKYGFSLVTLLLTASALITTTDALADRVAASCVVIVLVLVLFLMDRYWWVLLREAAIRASELERNLGIEISQRLSDIAHQSHNTQAASVIYAVFVVVSCGVALVTVVPRGWTFALFFTIGFAAAAVVAIWKLHCWFEDHLASEIS